MDILETALGSLLFYIEFFQEPFLLILQRQDFSCKGKWLMPSRKRSDTGECFMHLWELQRKMDWRLCTMGTVSLTLQVPVVTNINFLLTISICCQEKWLWELIKWSLKRKCIDLLSNSQRNVWRLVWRIYMWILGLRGLTVILSMTNSYFLLSKLSQLHCTFMN